MIRVFILFVCGLLGAVSTPPLWADSPERIHVNYQPIREPNQCLADAVGFQTTLLIQYPGAWSRILKVNWDVRVDRQFTAHAYCIYEINGQLHAYDSIGGQRRLRLNPSLKFDADSLGHHLAGSHCISASYLTAFDPANTDLPYVMVGRMDAPHLIGLRSGEF